MTIIIKVIVPNSTAGMIIGKGGSYIKHLKETSGSFIQLSQKAKDNTLPERVVTIIGENCQKKKDMTKQIQSSRGREQQRGGVEDDPEQDPGGSSVRILPQHLLL